MRIDDLNGLVLSGGLSSRMGHDKGGILYHGMPQREFLFQELRKHCNEVFTSCRRDQNVPDALNPLLDKFEIKGPLNGILSAFEQNPTTAWLIVAVDMPNVNGATISQLINGRNPKNIATCFHNKKENFPEPLLTIWEPNAYPKLLEFYHSGHVSPKRFLIDQNAHQIIPSNPDFLLNINSQTEYENFRSGFKQD